MNVSRLSLILFVTLGTAPGWGQDPLAPLRKVPASLQAELDAVVQAERAFARLSEDKGMKEAFLANLAAGSVLFRPGPVDGRSYVTEQPATLTVLSWRPIQAGIAASGDLAFTTGPWEIRAKPGAPATLFGHYVTLWKKAEDGGPWKVVFDGGISTPKAEPASGEAAGAFTVDPLAAIVAPTALEPAAAKGALMDADRAFAVLARQRGIALAYLATLTDQARLLRDGAAPRVGKVAIRKALAAETTRLSWEPQGADVAWGGDFGYTYGTVTFTPKTGAPSSGYYLRIWHRQKSAPWKVLLDLVTSPTP
jgi:ketosteroid isomerase-like protein